jgi:hypothetical protein
MILIPFFDNACFSQDIVLDAVPYHIVFYWNARGEFWVLDVYDRDLNLLVAGIKIVNEYELFYNHPDHGLPPGKLYVIDYRGEGYAIAYDDFTKGNCELVYMEAETVTA